MRVTLETMSPAAFAGFADASVADYARDLQDVFSGELAYEEALREFGELLPQGADTPGQYVRSVRDAETGRDVGWIWYQTGEPGEPGEAGEAGGVRQAYLNDLLIFEGCRRRGYASAALEEMEKAAAAAGCAESVLFVWRHNGPGMGLYEKSGYAPFREQEGGVYMKKTLAD